MKKYFLIGAVMLLISHYSTAQIFAQGKNINNENIFSITTELVPKPMDPGKYHASISFYGQRGDIKWYLKEGVEHKVFIDKRELIAYLEENGWFYLHSIKPKNSTVNSEREKHLFRKSMEQLARENEIDARNVE
jgi:hypothetical protein